VEVTVARVENARDCVQRRRHPADHWMPNPALDGVDGLSGHGTRINKNFDMHCFACLAPLLAPEVYKRGLVIAHDNSGIRAADEGMTVPVPCAIGFITPSDVEKLPG
jgi:hypothetical protein